MVFRYGPGSSTVLLLFLCSPFMSDAFSRYLYRKSPGCSESTLMLTGRAGHPDIAIFLCLLSFCISVYNEHAINATVNNLIYSPCRPWLVWPCV